MKKSVSFAAAWFLSSGAAHEVVAGFGSLGAFADLGKISQRTAEVKASKGARLSPIAGAFQRTSSAIVGDIIMSGEIVEA